MERNAQQVGWITPACERPRDRWTRVPSTLSTCSTYLNGEKGMAMAPHSRRKSYEFHRTEHLRKRAERVTPRFSSGVGMGDLLPPPKHQGAADEAGWKHPNPRSRLGHSTTLSGRLHVEPSLRDATSPTLRQDVALVDHHTGFSTLKDGRKGERSRCELLGYGWLFN